MAPSRASAPKKRGKPSVASKAAAVQPSQPKSSGAVSKRGKPASAAQPAPPRKPSGVTKKSRPSGSTGKRVSLPSSSVAVSKRARPTKEDAGRRSSGQTKAVRVPQSIAATSEESFKHRRRNAEEDELAGDPAEQPQAPKFSFIAPRIRHVPQEVISTKWKAPSQQVQKQVSEVLASARTEVILTQRNDRKRIDAERTLKEIVGKIETRMGRMVLPPDAKDLHFNLGRLIERHGLIESQITPAQHAILLLQGELERQQVQFDSEKETLKRLQRDAKSWKDNRKKIKLHPLLRRAADLEIKGDGPDDIGLKASKPRDLQLLDRPDPELTPVLQQLRRSLESMQSNHAQVEGIDEAIRDAQMALGDVLSKHASSE